MSARNPNRITGYRESFQGVGNLNADLNVQRIRVICVDTQGKPPGGQSLAKLIVIPKLNAM